MTRPLAMVAPEIVRNLLYIYIYNHNLYKLYIHVPWP